MRKIKNPKPNEFILVTKYSDHDPNDPWALGWFTRKGNWKGEITYYVKDEYGYESSYPKYKYCFRLTSDDIKKWISLIAKDWKLEDPFKDCDCELIYYTDFTKEDKNE